MHRTLFVLVCFFLLSVVLFAQVSTEGSFIGTVTDSSGAVVPNAEVVVKHLATGLTRTATTGASGEFTILALPIGEYSVAVTAAGFKTWELARTQLAVGERARITPALEVGQASERVTIEASAEVVQTEKATVETVVQMQQIRELPLPTRNPLALVAMVPGMRVDSIQNDGERATFVQGQGLRNNKTGFQLDGVNSNAPMDEGGTAIPNVDTVAEFNVQTLNFTAESGRDPMQVLVVTKSGTNEFHGAAWEFLQNDAFNARRTFAVTQDRVRRNQFGGTLGGPVIRNKTFFFAGYEGLIRRSATIYNSYAVTPTMKRGDFSALNKTIKNPFDSGNPFPNNQIPDSLISPASKYFLRYILEANSSDGFFRTNASSGNDVHEGTMRVDHNVTSTQRLYGRYVTVRQPIEMLGYNPTPDITGWQQVKQHNLGFNYTWTMSPNTLLTLTAGTMRTRSEYGNPALGKQNDAEKAGIQGIPTKGREAWVGPPNLGFASGYTGVSFPGGWGVPGALWGDVYNGKASFNHIRGSHTIAAGFEYGDWHTYGEHGSQSPRGYFGFGNLYTGDGFGDYLLGLTSYSERNDPLKHFGVDHQPYTGIYVQDSWRMRPNLTLDFGVRYERWWSRHNVGEVSSTWDPVRNQTVVAVNSKGQPNLTAFTVTPYLAAATQGLWTTAREAGYPDGLYEPNGNWAPRTGIVYRPFINKQFVIRAGYGIYFNNYTGNRGGSTINVPHWSMEAKTIGLNTLQPWETFWPAAASAFGTFRVYAPAYNVRPARTHEWNISVQTALPFKTALTVSYVGTRVPNEVAAKEYNEAPIGPHQNLQADRPNPRFSGITIVQNFGATWYNGLQTKLERRFSDGLSFSLAYSFSRTMADNTPDCELCNLVPYSPTWYNRGRTGFDRRHIEYATMVWEMPFGRGRKYLTDLNRPANLILGGWQLAFTQQGMSGWPLSIGGGTANFGNGWGSRADVVGDPGINNPSTAKWFNTGAFKTPALYTFGTSGIGILEGPGFLALNTSLSKAFYVTEKKYFQFRWEVFNATNRANYNNPVTSVTSNTFGRITSSGDARYMQLGLKFLF